VTTADHEQDAKQNVDKLPPNIGPELTINQRKYMKKRVINKMQIYELLAVEQRRRYIVISMVSVILGE
jgi:hypothetical protein